MVGRLARTFRDLPVAAALLRALLSRPCPASLSDSTSAMPGLSSGA